MAVAQLPDSSTFVRTLWGLPQAAPSEAAHRWGTRAAPQPDQTAGLRYYIHSTGKVLIADRQLPKKCVLQAIICVVFGRVMFVIVQDGTRDSTIGYHD